MAMNKALAKQLGATLRLPRTSFPLRHNPESDELHVRALSVDLYRQQREMRQSAPLFALHDGPPFANGDLHAGHALNKVLKDIALRHWLMEGHRIELQSGWDCHGLPIEMKALQSQPALLDQDPLSIRQLCREFAKSAIERQKRQMRDWGLLVDPDAHYETQSPAYQARELRLLAKLVRRDLVYRAHRPVHWSPSSRTALAEAELEYRDDHATMQAWIKMPIIGENLSALIWTTTPWTLLANQAIGFNPQLEYCVARDGNGVHYILATELLGKQPIGLTHVRPLSPLGLRYRNPLGQDCPFLAADWVEAGQGTGLVHLAPAHGLDDCATCQAHAIQPLCFVDEEGRYDLNVPIPELAGQSVLEANEAVLRYLNEFVAHASVLVHRYPMDWRTKQPLIQRATPQWFLDIERIKPRLPAILEQVRFLPEAGKRRLLNGCLGRSSWCISRQRVWGTPLPSVIDRQTGEAKLCPSLIERLADQVEKHPRGSDVWWEDSFQVNEGIKGKDTLDVWFDSGCSWASSQSSPASFDLIIEGSDQHRGWFQSLLLTAILSEQERAPFATLCTHGFIMDGQGRKMSKSLGNVVEPGSIVQRGGQDLLRWWVASGDWQADICIGQEILQACSEQRQKIRNTVRFLLANRSSSHPSSLFLSPLNGAALNLAVKMQQQVRAHLANLDTKRACTTIHSFVDELSAIYLDAIKDRLYADAQDSPAVQECRQTVSTILALLLQALQPLLPFLAHEAYSHLAAKPEYRYANLTFNSDILIQYEQIKELRTQALRMYESQGIKDPSPYLLVIPATPLHEEWQTDLADILRVSRVELGGKLDLKPLDGFKCPRCWRHWSEAENQVCARCESQIQSVGWI